MMGSMGTAVGEKITRLFEYATEHGLPVVGYTVSGGARMQEGILSLMQMAKTSAAVERFSQQGRAVHLRPHRPHHRRGHRQLCHAWGTSSWPSPGPLIGFAGPRVIEQTIGETLPEGFQRAEFLLEHGFVDAIVPRRPSCGTTLATLLQLHGKEGEADERTTPPTSG